MAPVERRDPPDSESLRGCDDRGVNDSKGEVRVSLDEVRDSKPVSGMHRFGSEISDREISEKAQLVVYSKPSLEEVGDLGDCEHRNDEPAGFGSEERFASLVCGIVAIDEGKEWARVHYE